MYDHNDLAAVIVQVPAHLQATANSLIVKARRWTPTEKQARFIDSIVRQAKGEQVRPQAPKVEIGSLSSVLAMFAKAEASKLRFPKILIRVGDNIVKLNVAGERSKAPGSINVTSEGRYGENTWYGRIGTDGNFAPARAAEQLPSLVQALQAFAAEPEKVAAEYGRWQGACCFCGRRLDDEKSTEVGYGPVCAQRYGLAWGNKGSK